MLGAAERTSSLGGNCQGVNHKWSKGKARVVTHGASVNLKYRSITMDKDVKFVCRKGRKKGEQRGEQSRHPGVGKKGQGIDRKNDIGEVKHWRAGPTTARKRVD